MSIPIISVVIPAYNVESYLLLTLESVKNQSLNDFECIVVEDYSTDNTKKVCLDYIKSDKRFKMIAHRANGGLSAARNTGLRAAKGKYICFLDSDDLFMTNSLEVRVKTLESNQAEHIIGTYCGSIGIDQDCKVPPASSPTKLKKIDFITAGGNCPFNANQPMFNREKFIHCGGFDHSLKQAEDYDMWMRVLRLGYQILPTDINAVTYRATPGSMIKRDPMLHLHTSFERFTSCYDSPDLKNIPVEIDIYNKFLNKGLSEYLAQLNIANRVLEFVGISLAVGKEFGLAHKLVAYLPDYFKVIESHRPFLNGLLKGVNRGLGYNVNSNVAEKIKYISKIEKLREEFISLVNSALLNQERINQANLRLEKGSFEVNQLQLTSQLGAQSLIDIVFIPHKDYHVATIDMMKESLAQLGLKFIILDISMHYRNEGVKSKAEELGLPLIGYSNFLLGRFSPKLMISFNDWDPIVRSIMVSAQNSGIKTAAIVEGIQDYNDADTGQERWAYRTVDTVFLPGDFDAKYFVNTGQQVESVGIPRIHHLRHGPQNILNWVKPKALINSNFSYGVLEEHRDQWVKDVVEACLEAGFEPVISRHPADVGIEYMDYQTNESFYEALSDCSVHISKFASGILEALAVGCPVVYFNPHNEKVDKFKDPLGAYSQIETKSDLINELKCLEKKSINYLQNVDSFLDLHSGAKQNDSSEKLTLFINDMIVNHNNNVNFEVLKNKMLSLDSKTGSFNNIHYLRSNIKATYSDLITPNVEALNILPVLKGDGVSIKDYHRYVTLGELDNASIILKILLANHPNFQLYHRLIGELVKLYRITDKKIPTWINNH